MSLIRSNRIASTLALPFISVNVMVLTIYTIGHSSHDFAQFLSLLKQVNINHIIDIRRSPRSTRFSQYNIDALVAACESDGEVKYSFLGEIFGARRRRYLGDLNSALTDTEDQAYADHMQRPEFAESIKLLLHSNVVLMCSENDPDWCHRSLLADYLTLVHQVDVKHILFDGKIRQHQVNAYARLNDQMNSCVYPSVK